MATELGRFLRKLRIDNDELLRDMARKLGMSSAMLSSIENSKRKPAENFAAAVVGEYKLDDDQVRALDLAVARAREEVAIRLDSLRAPNQELAVAFARRIGDLDENSVETIRKLLGHEKTDR